MRSISRRDFVLKSVVGSTMLALSSLLQGCNKRKAIPRFKSRIVRVTNEEITNKTGGKDNSNLNESTIREMVSTGIKIFTGKGTLEEAWAEIIPDPNRRVAIKVNCQITSIYTKAKVVNAVTEGLLLRGVSPSNIIIYDLTDNAFSYAGFKKNLGPGIKIGTNNELGGYSWISWFGIPFPLIGGNRFCKVLAGEGRFGCEYLINMPVLKALDGYSGVSISMKNHFGSISNCGKLHSKIQDSLAALNTRELIVGKTRLILLDAIFSQYKWFNGRNQDTVDITNQLLFGNDPVAIDYVGWRMLERLRERHGLSELRPKPDYIHKAAVEYGVGNADPENIEIIDI